MKKTTRALILEALPKALEDAGYRPDWKDLKPAIAALKAGKTLDQETSRFAAAALQYLALRLEIEDRAHKRGNPGARASRNAAAVADALVKTKGVSKTAAIAAAAGPGLDKNFDRIKKALQRQKKAGRRPIAVPKKQIDEATERLKPASPWSGK